ncbi:DUF3325 domain-containing protein [Microbulbifer sp.]|uniref:DUF3325 domain-containing protein n=1 Tax=Microbulbifer sp. TaxID=1908541 RepID=UPI0025901A3A|nr:DUF3325 domain-containing protein [Microbulbifer sp.]
MTESAFSLSTLAAITQALLTLAALSCLCLASAHHLRQSPGQATLKQWQPVLFWCGWALLATAAATAITTQGWGLGLVTLLGILSVAAFAVVGLASYRRTGLAPTALVSGVCGVALFAKWLLAVLLSQ